MKLVPRATGGARHVDGHQASPEAGGQVISYDLGLDSCVFGGGYGRKYSPHRAFLAPLTPQPPYYMPPSKKYRNMRPTCAPMLIQVPGRPHQAPGARALQHLQSQTGYPGRPSRTKCRIRCERRRAVDGPSRRDELQGVHTARMRSWQSGTEGVGQRTADLGTLEWVC